MAFAEREFELSEVEEGATIREHLLKLKKDTGVAHDLLTTAPALPQGAAHVWAWFCEIRNATPKGQRITGTIMRDTQWMLGIEMELWERSAIRRLDSLFIRGVIRE